MTKLAKCIKQHPGGLSALCEHLGVHAPDVSRWASGKRPVPIKYCHAIEQFYDGKVTRKDLRPDDWHMIWPELAEKATA